MHDVKSSARHFLIAFTLHGEPPSPARAMSLAGWEGVDGALPPRVCSKLPLYIWSEDGVQIHLNGRGGDAAAEHIVVDFPGKIAAREGGGDVSFQLSRGALVCARSLPGVVPIAWRKIGDVWWISSDLEILRLLSPVLTQPNLARLRAYLHGHLWAPETEDFISGIERVPAGWQVKIEPRSGLVSSSRTLDDTWPSQYDRSIDDSRVWEALQRAFSRADERGSEEGGYVSTLSGGLDSGVWCAWASRYANSPLRTASMLFDNSPQSDERAVIQRVLEAIRPHRHAGFCMDDEWPLKELSFYGQFLGFGPQHHPGEVYETGFLRRVVDEYDVSAIATGVGADELFRSFASLSLRESISRGDFRALAFWQRTLGMSALWTQTGLTLAQHILPPPFLRLLAIERERQRTFEVPEWLVSVEETHVGDEWWTQRARALLLEPHGVVTFCTRWFESWEWELVVRALWRNMRRAGVITLLPYLDQALWRVLIALPPDLRWGGGKGGRLFDKLALRRITQQQRLLPGDLPWRPKSVFFDQHINKGWAIHEAKRTQELLDDMKCVEYGLVDGGGFERHVGQSMSVLKKQEGVARIDVHSIWRTLAVELWLRYLSMERTGE